MRIRLDRYDICILINGLNTMREKYSQKVNDYVSGLIFRLIDIYDNTNPRRKARIIFDSNEIHVIRIVLIDWRNQFIQEGKPSAAEGVGELILKIAG